MAGCVGGGGFDQFDQSGADQLAALDDADVEGCVVIPFVVVPFRPVKLLGASVEGAPATAVLATQASTSPPHNARPMNH